MQQNFDTSVLKHNRPSAVMWGAGGRSYDQVSFAISDALAHAAQRLAPAHGSKTLDCATGTGAVAEFFGLIGAHSKEPPPQQSPLSWGDPDYLRTLFEDVFDLQFESGVNHAYHESPDAIWQWYLDGFGPLCLLHASLDPDFQSALKRDVDAYHEHYRVPAGLCVKRDYLVTIGTRR
jgi:hypothetical protein